jgi:hypothetical protein
VVIAGPVVGPAGNPLVELAHYQYVGGARAKLSSAFVDQFAAEKVARWLTSLGVNVSRESKPSVLPAFPRPAVNHPERLGGKPEELAARKAPEELAAAVVTPEEAEELAGVAAANLPPEDAQP